jgi:hypothetical protein
MKFLFDLLPVLLFFAAYKFAGASPEASHALATQLLGQGIVASQAPILIATGVAIVATIGQVLWLMARGRKVDTMLWVSLAIIVVFGGATLFFHDATFIKWKPTVLYWLFALTLTQPDPRTDAGAGGTARPCMVATQRVVDRLLHRDGCAQPLRGLQLQRRGVGELQALRRHGSDVPVRARARFHAVASHRRKEFLIQ